jgi:hypothetical protein
MKEGSLPEPKLVKTRNTFLCPSGACTRAFLGDQHLPGIKHKVAKLYKNVGLLQKCLQPALEALLRLPCILQVIMLILLFLVLLVGGP